ncbi:MAG: beta-lactamase family protein [Ignavibacteriae bacterium]|nr:beta-lactamase family protein [Ignavibacteriota bacterium]MCB9243028.1 beta-lactamase family protein [Ignavibacteriales bacterium]
MKRAYLIIFLSLLLYTQAYPYDFSEVDAIVENGIRNRSYPGAQLLIGTNNEILYSKSYGYYTYDQSTPVTENSIFDLASLTKVIATTSAIMKLYDQGKLSLDDRVAYYLPDFAVNGKEWITVRNLLLHNSGLKAWIPFYTTCKNKDDVIKTICDQELKYEPGTSVEYSDLNAILLGVIVEKVTDMGLDEYCRQEIFEPLGMSSTTFNPKGKLNDLALPTEYDNNWRGRQLKGEVHDESAAVMGGVSGNAGLFSNTEDIYKLVSTLMNEGRYYNSYSAGLKIESFVYEGTVDLFLEKPNDVFYYNTRLLGWDSKPEPNSYGRPCGDMISDNCFGHTGYTGTSVWCDRDRNLVIIFLTNRVYPSRTAKGIWQVRPELHDKIIELYTNQQN